jgi:hypothetical protein
MERKGGTRGGGIGLRFIGRGGRIASRGGIGCEVDPHEAQPAADDGSMACSTNEGGVNRGGEGDWWFFEGKLMPHLFP